MSTEGIRQFTGKNSFPGGLKLLEYFHRVKDAHTRARDTGQNMHGAGRQPNPCTEKPIPGGRLSGSAPPFTSTWMTGGGSAGRGSHLGVVGADLVDLALEVFTT